MSTNDKTIPLRINVVDFVWLMMLGWLAIEKNPAWWLAVVAVIAGWFIPPKWRRITIFNWRAKK